MTSYYYYYFFFPSRGWLFSRTFFRRVLDGTTFIRAGAFILLPAFGERGVDPFFFEESEISSVDDALGSGAGYTYADDSSSLRASVCRRIKFGSFC